MQILAVIVSCLAIYFSLQYIRQGRLHEPLRLRNEKQWQVIQLLLSRLSNVSTEEYFEDTLTAVEFLLDADIEKLEEEK